MHVHGNHLNLSTVVETNATNRTTASQRAAEVRRKLLQGFTEKSDFEDAFAEGREAEEEGDIDPATRRKQARRAGPFRAAEVSEDEGAHDHRTSLWA